MNLNKTRMRAYTDPYTELKASSRGDQSTWSATVQTAMTLKIVGLQCYHINIYRSLTLSFHDGRWSFTQRFSIPRLSFIWIPLTSEAHRHRERLLCCSAKTQSNSTYGWQWFFGFQCLTDTLHANKTRNLPSFLFHGEKYATVAERKHRLPHKAASE